MRNRDSLDGAELGNRDLEVGQEFEQEGLELVVGAIDFIDQQHRRLGAADRGQQRPFQKIFLREDLILDREARIIMARIEGASASLALQIAQMVQDIRKEELRKVPGVAETLDWAAALVGLDVRDLHDDPEAVQETLMCLLKTQEDKVRMTRDVTARLLGKVA